MIQIEKIKNRFGFLGKELVDIIFENPIIKKIKSDQIVIKSGQYITHIPVVLNGLIKVFSKYEDKDLLLYYIDTDESCIMSFSSGMNREPSSVFAITVEETDILLLPVDKVSLWIKTFPKFNDFFFQQYNERYKELLDTINHLIFDKLDKRVFDYLNQKTKIRKQNPIKITHRQIAEELGTAREVISRILKKLDKNGYISIDNNGIEVLS